MGLDFSQRVQDATKDNESLEQLLGNGLTQPFTNTNSGSN